MFRGAVTYKAVRGLRSGTCQRRRSRSIRFSTTDWEAEAEAVVAIIRKARPREPDGTIAVIVRARTHLPAIVNALAGFQ